MGTLGEVLGVLMIASPEIGELLTSVREQLAIFVYLSIAALLLLKVYRIRDPTQRTLALGLMIVAISARMSSTAADRMSEALEGGSAPRTIKAAVEQLHKEILDSQTASNAHATKLFGRHLPLRLSGVALVVFGLIVGLIGHLG